MILTDRQIKWLIRIFPISGVLGPIGMILNSVIYAGIIWWILIKWGVV